MGNLLNFLSNTADGVLAVDWEHRIVFWNEAAEKLLGFKAQEVLGRFCYEVIAGRDESGLLFCQANCLEKMKCFEREAVPTNNILVTTKTGQEVWLSVSTVLVPSEYRVFSVLIHLFRNVTYLKELERSIQQLLTTVSKLSAGKERGLNEVPFSGLLNLTHREREILRCLASGSTTKVIAKKLFITPATVRNHIHNVLAKLGVRNRLDAAMFALRNGLI